MSPRLNAVPVISNLKSIKYALTLFMGKIRDCRGQPVGRGQLHMIFF